MLNYKIPLTAKGVGGSYVDASINQVLFMFSLREHVKKNCILSKLRHGKKFFFFLIQECPLKKIHIQRKRETGKGKFWKIPDNTAGCRGVTPPPSSAECPVKNAILFNFFYVLPYLEQTNKHLLFKERNKYKPTLLLMNIIFTTILYNSVFHCKKSCFFFQTKIFNCIFSVWGPFLDAPVNYESLFIGSLNLKRK